MKGFLQTTLSIVALVVVLSAIGLTIEWFRRRSVQKWAQKQGGTFEAGTILGGAALPEAAPFDARAEEKVTYNNVSRFTRPEASYIVAQYHTTWKNTKNEVQSFSCVMCFVILPGEALPAVRVGEPVRGTGLGALLGMPAPPVPLKVPEAVPAFAEAFQVVPVSGEKEIRVEALPRLLPTEVQEELLAKRELISGLQARGNVVRIQAVSQYAGYPHQEVFAFARRLAAHWGPR